MKEIPKGSILIAKPGTWFRAGTECVVVADCESAGLIVSGIRDEDGKQDEELCLRNEFEGL